MCCVLLAPLLSLGLLALCVPMSPRTRRWVLALGAWAPWVVGWVAALVGWRHTLARAREESASACIDAPSAWCRDLAHFVPSSAADLERTLAEVGLPVGLDVAVLLDAMLLPNLLLPAVVLATFGLAIRRTAPVVLAHGWLISLVGLAVLGVALNG